MTQLTNLRLAGWKSIREAEIEFRPLNVLIGGNGAGKSNLVSFFEMIGAMRESRLQFHIAASGGAEKLFHFGSKRTSAIEAEFRFATDFGQSDYSFRLVPAVGNTLIFDEKEKLIPLIFNEEEKLKYYRKERPAPSESKSISTEGGHRESDLDSLYNLDNPDTDFDKNGKLISAFLKRSQVFHFHDTSLKGPMRRGCPINQNRFLHSDASNLPAMLYLYRERFPTVYSRTVAAVRAVAPFFDDFVLEPLRLKPREIELNWRATGEQYAFDAYQLSDGTLRAIALCTLLLQPEEDLPELIVLDEPELGLHPAALAVLADLLKGAARHSQVLVATQSTALIDHFEVEDIVTVNLRAGVSTFERLNPERLKQWLEEYTVSELWERNVIGGGPY